MTVNETNDAIIQHIRDILTKKGETPSEHMITASDFNILHLGSPAIDWKSLDWCMELEKAETGVAPEFLKFVMDLKLAGGGKRARCEEEEVAEKPNDPHFIKCLITTFKTPWSMADWEKMALSSVVTIETLDEMRNASQKAGSAEFKSQKVLECIGYVRDLKLRH